MSLKTVVIPRPADSASIQLSPSLTKAINKEISVMVNFPPEVWLNIALFVCDDELRHFLGVNSVFFDIAMNLRWKEIVIMTRDTSEAMHILTRLSSGIPVPSC